MIRINLLPPEIVERRKYERFYPIVIIIGVTLVAAVIVAWGILSFMAGAARSELQTIEQSASDLLAQAESLRVFELKEQELAAREKVAAEALAGRIDMGRLAEEISLVLPDEVWVQRLECSEQNGLSAAMYAPEPLGRSALVGYRAAASTLVRLASLASVSDVWLGQASVSRFSGFQGIPLESPEVQALSFEVSAKIRPASGADGTSGQEGQ